MRSVGRIPGGYVTNHVYTWVDPQGRSVSPPPDLHEHRSATLRRSDSQRRSNMQLLQEGDEKKVRVPPLKWIHNSFSVARQVEISCDMKTCVTCSAWWALLKHVGSYHLISIFICSFYTFLLHLYCQRVLGTEATNEIVNCFFFFRIFLNNCLHDSEYYPKFRLLMNLYNWSVTVFYIIATQNAEICPCTLSYRSGRSPSQASASTRATLW